MKNFSSHPSTFTSRTENFGKRLLEKKLKAKKVPHPIKIKEYLGGKREITLKKFGKRFPKYFCVQREIWGGKRNHILQFFIDVCRIQSRTCATHKFQSKKQLAQIYFSDLLNIFLTNCLINYYHQGYMLANALVLDDVLNTKMQVLFAYHMTLISKELYEVN
jgi:hypothetical protein